jgi:hypothetical protein
MSNDNSMEKLSFQDFIELCELNIDKKYVKECIEIAKNQDCIFVSGIIMEQDYTSSLYSLRLEIAKDIKRRSESYLQDFEDCVINLKNSSSLLLGITSIYGNESHFMIFYEPGTKVILGVLKSDSDLITVENFNTETINMGYSSDAEKYSKGILIRDWKKLKL